MHTLHVHYYNSKKAWFISAFISDWFHNHFVPEVFRYKEEVLNIDTNDLKPLLVLDNARVHPSDEKLVSADWKIHVMFLPTNTTPVMQRYSGCKRRVKTLFI